MDVLKKDGISCLVGSVLTLGIALLLGTKIGIIPWDTVILLKWLGMILALSVAIVLFIIGLKKILFTRSSDNSSDV